MKSPFPGMDPYLEPHWLDLQALVDRAYSSGRYHLRLDYSKPCDPPLEPEDAAWADDLLRRQGRPRQE